MMFPGKFANSVQPGPTCGLAVLRSALLGILLPVAPLAQSQTSEEMRTLLFEPVLIEVTDMEGATMTRELTRLPGGEDAPNVTDYLIARFSNAYVEPPDFSDAIAGYEQNIRDLELRGGAYEPALAQELLALGNLYQAQGDHETALEYLEKAQHINRVNLGLNNLEQETIIEEKIESFVALGDLHAADQQQEYLFYLKRKEFGSTSIDLLPALTRYAEWNIFAFDSRLVMNPALTYAAQSSLYDSGVSNSIGEEDFRTLRLVNAQNIYRTIIQILLNNYGASDKRLLDMEKQLALTNYFFATNLDIAASAFSSASPLGVPATQGYYEMTRVSANSMGYRHGREALERRLEYLYGMEGVDPLEIARAKVELADWLLLFKKRQAALETYEEAYAELKANGASQDAVDTLFNPEFPATLPTFIDYRYSRAALKIPDDQALDYRGWFDVSIRINRFGQPQDVSIIGRSLNTTEPVEIRLLRHLRNGTSFRPRFSNDALLEDETITARYYYSY